MAETTIDNPLKNDTAKFKLSAIIVTRNEEKKIKRCLSSLAWTDEIIVVDQSSTDKTAAICQDYTDKVFVVSAKGFCEPDRPFAASKARNEWILYIDADEEVSQELKVEIESVLSGKPDFDCYYMPRKNIFLGKWIRGSGWYPGYVLRLFRNGSVRFSNDIHTDLLPLRAAGYLKAHLIHYTCENLQDYINKSNRYTSVLAQQSYARGDRISAKNFIWRLFILPAVYFLHRFILKRGIRDGSRGFLIALLTCRTIFIKHAKLWAMQKEAKR